MERWACVDLPALPLQLLLRQRPEWRGLPAVVVDEDKPQGKILWANRQAQATRVLPGLRYAAGLSLCAELRAAVVAPTQIEDGVAEVAAQLYRLTPHVEPADGRWGQPGLFWLDASGLGRLFPSLSTWAEALLDACRRRQLYAHAVVGFTRFYSYAMVRALAHGPRRWQVFDSAEEERAVCAAVPIMHLELEPRVRDALGKLGVRTVGELLRLPEAGLRRRFGAEVARLHALARLAPGDPGPPLTPYYPEEPIAAGCELDYAERDHTRLLFVCKQLLDALLAKLVSRALALAAFTIEYKQSSGVAGALRLAPAEPSLDGVLLAGLLRLRLERLADEGLLAAGIVSLRLVVEGTRATQEQLRLFDTLNSAQINGRPRRDLRAANRALARLRAAFGAAAVVRAELADRHLPEARFAWAELTALAAPQPRPAPRAQALQRRLYAQPQPWASPGAATRLHGPYRLSGAWWQAEIARDYYFAEEPDGALWWVYFDQRRQRWFLHGEVA